MAELHGGILRQNEENGSIEITLKDSEKSNIEYRIETKISMSGSSESVSQNVYENNQEITKNRDKVDTLRESIFSVGYGSGRTISGTRSYEEYAIIDSAYSLFNYEHPLQNPELGVRRIQSKKKLKELKEYLKKILILREQDKIELLETGMYIQSQWGKMPFNALSDGYQSLTTVILDFLSWKLLHDSKNFNLTNISGIFIIDEIEQHLHPKWQRKIISILSERFPHIQFIGSTHTPICALGLNDLTCESQLIKASYTKDNSHSEVKPFDMKEDYKGYRVDQILTSGIFELSSARSKNIEEKLKEYRDIYLKNINERDSTEKKKLEDIERELKNLPMWDTLKDKRTREELIQLIKENRGD